MLWRKAITREYGSLPPKGRRHLQRQYAVAALPGPLRRGVRTAEPYVRIALGGRVRGLPKPYRLARVWLDRRDLAAGRRPMPTQDRAGRAERWLLR